MDRQKTAVRMRRPGKCSPSYIHSTLRALRLQHVRRLEKITWRWGLGSKGTSRGWGEKQTKCFNSCPFFFFTYFAQGSDFLLKGWAFYGPRALLSRACLLWEAESCFWGEERGGEKKMEYFTVHIKAKPVRENAVHLNFKQRLATNEEKKNLPFFLLNFWQANCSSGKMECHSHVTSSFTAVPWWCRRHVNWEGLEK